MILVDVLLFLDQDPVLFSIRIQDDKNHQNHGKILSLLFLEKLFFFFFILLQNTYLTGYLSSLL